MKHPESLQDRQVERHDSAMNIDWTQPRPAALVMRPERLAATLPNALSFARTLFDRFYEDSWALTRVRIDLDREGRGEVLYRLASDRHVLHFLILSDAFSTDQKADRSYNMNWDATAALCEGEWSAEREEFLRREIPKQRFGRLDHQTLAYTRGNRSGRLFDYVVDCLAEGRQPDGAMLAPVGYIFRTTGFTANGFIGMRSYLGLENGHILGRPYHAQMCSAFLLREYVADLVDAMAAARNPGAARLSAPLRRYLGIGNSAGLGLTPFICNHPHMVHRWTLSKEQALADVRRQTVGHDDAAVQTFRRLLAKAKRYFTEDPRDGNEIFLSYAHIAQELGRAIVWSETTLLPLLDGGPRRIWLDMADWAEHSLHPEAIEVLNTILLELYPELTRQYSHNVTVDETLDIDATMTLGDLKRLIAEHYDWAEACFHDLPQAADNFWYMSTEAPYEPRRGKRGVLPAYEFETHMDAPLRFRQLQLELAQHGGDIPLAAFLIEQPRFRNVTARLCSLRNSCYAQLRENTLARGHTTFGSTRFMLSHYGMDKLDAQKPRSVKGVLLQGAPIADDLPQRGRGDWPFAVVPQADLNPATVSPYREERQLGAKELTKLAVWRESDFGEKVIAAPVELLRWGQRALQVKGYDLGSALLGSHLMHLRELLAGDGLSLMLSQCEISNIQERRLHVTERGGLYAIRSEGASAFTAAPALLDLACYSAARNTQGFGASLAVGLMALPLLETLPVAAARRGFDCIVLWRDALIAGDADVPWRISMGCQEAQGHRLRSGDRRGRSDLDSVLEALHDNDLRKAIASLAADFAKTKASLCCVVCFNSSRVEADMDPLIDRLDHDLFTETVIADKYRHGVIVDFKQLEAVKALAFETLLPAALEAPVATE
ncbi:MULTISPECIES: hypothetical protein [unclassified Chelatococcus]|uniref:hypothetical protein n=1 Tax=unclassified Chelatococcus TaxID=2638111 RepID=UPI001BCC4CDD|nr:MULTISPECIES: hypothetical protein [unclassified Chelatococcus]MBS7696695.1 hypothetical protein [Chelatococcus sp. YT9]MBX3555260.1 hypothetical protein [Chelatococcus sp.]